MKFEDSFFYEVIQMNEEKKENINDLTLEKLKAELAALKSEMQQLQHNQEQENENSQAERLETTEVLEAIDESTEELEIKAELICRWGAARAGAIVIAPVVGTVALMANEIYMVNQIAKLYQVKLTERAIFSFVGAISSRVIGHILATLIPFSVIQVPVAIGITYSLGRVTQLWLRDGMPEDLNPYIDMMDDWKEKAREQAEKLKEYPLKNIPLGDETIDFMKRWGHLAQEKLNDVKKRGKNVYNSVRYADDLVNEIVKEAEKSKQQNNSNKATEDVLNPDTMDSDKEDKKKEEVEPLTETKVTQAIEDAKLSLDE